MQSTIFDRLAKRSALKEDFEESRLASKMKKAIYKIKGSQRSSKNLKEARGGLYSMGARGVYVKDGSIYSRKIVVKACYVKNNKTGFAEKIKAYFDYISRDHAGKDAHKPELFSKESVQEISKDMIADFTKSEHNFRFIISPEDGDKLELKEFTRNLIKAIEKDLGTQLSWVASCHYDTNEPHVHLVVDGKNDIGKKLLMTRDYISRGIRNRASEIINNKLGLQSDDEITKRLEISAVRSNKSELDVVIKNNIKDDCINLKSLDNKDSEIIRPQILERRLNYLASKGLAFNQGEQSWRIKENYLDDLRALGRTSSIIERLSRKLAVNKDRCELISAASLAEKSPSGQVVGRGFVNEIDEGQYVIVKTEQGKHLYVELEKYSEKSPTKVGEWVRIDATKSFDGPKSSDRTIARIAEEKGGIYDAADHERQVLKELRLPPGVSAHDYIQVHLKRLELLTRLGLASKLSDNKFVIPDNYLEKLAAYAQSSAQKYQAHIKISQISPPKISSPKVSSGMKL